MFAKMFAAVPMLIGYRVMIFERIASGVCNRVGAVKHEGGNFVPPRAGGRPAAVRGRRLNPATVHSFGPDLEEERACVATCRQQSKQAGSGAYQVSSLATEVLIVSDRRCTAGDAQGSIRVDYYVALFPQRKPICWRRNHREHTSSSDVRSGFVRVREDCDFIKAAQFWVSSIA